jgi:hypothetical protein
MSSRSNGRLLETIDARSMCVNWWHGRPYETWREWVIIRAAAKLGMVTFLGNKIVGKRNQRV